MPHPSLRIWLSLVATLAAGCATSNPAAESAEPLVGAWRSRIQFSSGDFASVKDLEFLCVFNRGGTMTESSNYDSAPPVPPAYGAWRSTGPRRFEATYVFYTTKPPESLDQISKGGGWSPAGRGQLTERIELAPDNRAYTSVLSLQLFDQSGKPIAGGGEASGRAERIGF